MATKKPRDKRLFVAYNMPPLRKTQPGQEYDHKQDEVLKWISERPGLLMYVFEQRKHIRLQHKEQSPVLTFIV